MSSQTQQEQVKYISDSATLGPAVFQENDPTYPIAKVVYQTRTKKGMLVYTFDIPETKLREPLEELAGKFADYADFAIKDAPSALDHGIRGSTPCVHLQLIPRADIDLKAFADKLLETKLITPNPHGGMSTTMDRGFIETDPKINFYEAVCAAEQKGKGRITAVFSKVSSVIGAILPQRPSKQEAVLIDRTKDPDAGIEI